MPFNLPAVQQDFLKPCMFGANGTAVEMNGRRCLASKMEGPTFPLKIEGIVRQVSFSPLSGSCPMRLAGSIDER